MKYHDESTNVSIVSVSRRALPRRRDTRSFTQSSAAASGETSFRQVLLDVGEEHGQVAVGDRDHPALVAVKDRDRAPPVALAGQEPVAQAISDGGTTLLAPLERLDDRLLRLGTRHAGELRRLDEPLVVGVSDVRPAFRNLSLGRDDDHLYRQVVPLREGEVALVVRGTAMIAPVRTP